jgi:hypothetical protein
MYSILHKNIPIFLFIGLMVIASCGKQAEMDINDRHIEIRSNLNYIRTLNSDEINTGLRVCYSLKTKRLKYRADLNGQLFNMKSYQTSCSGAKEIQSFQSALDVTSTETMNYKTSYSGHHISDVPTDLNFPMSGICSQLFNGEIPENTMQMNSSTKMQFEFINEGDIDYVNIHYGDKDAKNKALDGYKTTSVKVFGIKTFPATPDLTGVIVNYFFTKPCVGSENQNTVAIELDSTASAEK